MSEESRESSALSVGDRNVDAKYHEALSILTVGDGDFSGSLAILRAYGYHIEMLVATSLVPSEAELISLYPGASGILEQLRRYDDSTKSSSENIECLSCKIRIFFGMDATQLHRDPRLEDLGRIDYILFHHPHIGYADDEKVSNIDKANGNLPSSCSKGAKIASRNASLLAHYLYSAKSLLQQDCREEIFSSGNNANNLDGHHARIHVCLCAGMSTAWKLHKSVRRLDLEMVGRPYYVSMPLFPSFNAADPLQSWEIGVSPHDHWLSRYAYHHQPTHPSLTDLSRVVNSHHFFFRILNKSNEKIIGRDSKGEDPFLVEADGEYSQIKSNMSGRALPCPACRQQNCEYDL